MNNYDITIAYRIYPKISKVPPIFSHDKLKMSELCLKSFIRALDGVNAKIYVLLDGCPEEYYTMFKFYLSGKDYELLSYNGIGNGATFLEQMKILAGQLDSELVYFAEDDYYYLPNAFAEMIEFINYNDNVDFLSPYDHPDYYDLDLHQAKEEIIENNQINWKYRFTTTMTFLCSKNTLLETYSIFETYTRGNDDASLWLSLARRRLLNPFLIFNFIFSSLRMVKIFVKAYLYGFKRLFFGKRYKLYAPTPTLSTHMDSDHLAPNIMWKPRFEELI